MALEPITRQEKIIAGQDLTPITRMEKFLKQFGGGGGFEYDFVIKITGLNTLTLEKGTYDSIIAKVGNQPVKGKIITIFEGGVKSADMDCILVIHNGQKLSVCGYSGDGFTLVSINPDNTVTFDGQ